MTLCCHPEDAILGHVRYMAPPNVISHNHHQHSKDLKTTTMRRWSWWRRAISGSIIDGRAVACVPDDTRAGERRSRGPNSERDDDELLYRRHNEQGEEQQQQQT